MKSFSLKDIATKMFKPKSPSPKYTSRIQVQSLKSKVQNITMFILRLIIKGSLHLKKKIKKYGIFYN